MAQKPSIPKGTRDFLPEQMIRRNYIFDTIRESFVRYGFLPIETPAMEKTETLLGKYGEEGDRLIFRILQRGEKLKKSFTNAYQQGEGLGLEVMTNGSEEALRYDLTVPFARYVVQHQNELSFPFKRYQIQPVWRADRPQKGRYREFFQCDADVVGSDSLIYEIELVQLFDEVLSKLGLSDFSIKINNRKILSGIAEVTGIPDKLVDMTVAIDKLDKIGEAGVIKELTDRGIGEDTIKKIQPLFKFGNDIKENLGSISAMLNNSDIGLKGVEELEFVFDTISDLGLNNAKVEFDVTLARGLNYYTGAIFEVTANNVSIGSICGGGRYDDLTGIFGLPGVSGVGISFGADRIYDVLDELDLFPSISSESTKLLFVNFGENEQKYCLSKLKLMREEGINSEIYPSNVKLQKQLKYADSKQIPFVAIIGSNEMNNDTVTIKDMQTGKQTTLDWNQAKQLLKK